MNYKRYSRQTQLQQFGEVAQQKLLEAKVLVVGAGGLGIPVLTYLNAMGVGSLGIMDNDVVSLSNLQRQVAYKEADVGALKVKVLSDFLKAQNSSTKITIYPELLNTENALKLIRLYDVVVDASDNFATRYLVNDACIILNKPFVYGALHGFEGQISVFNYQEGPSYRCLFPKEPKPSEVPNCDENGVLGVIPGIIGNLQALEVVKVITGVGELLSGKLLLFDGLQQSYQKIAFKKVPESKKITKLATQYGFECSISFQSIDSNHFQELWKTQKLQLLDVRSEQEFQENALENAMNIPLVALGNKPIDFDLSKTIYVICASGKRGQIAIEKLQKDYPQANLINVEGGMQKLNTDVAKY